MEKEIWVALISAFTTIASAIIGGYVTYKITIKPTKTGKKPNNKWIYIIVVLTIVGLGAFIYWIYQSTQTTKFYKALVSQGVMNNKEYIMPSVTMIIDLEKDSNNQIVSDTRIIYQVDALKDFNANQRTFIENYKSSSNEKVYYLPGSDNESSPSDVEQNKSWEVLFGLKTGEQRTIITGAHRIYPPELKDPRDVENFFKGVRGNEEAFVYPIQKDVIGEIIIMIQSKSLNLSIGNKAACIKHNDKIECEDALLASSTVELTNYKVVKARFNNPQVDDVVGVKIGWQQ